MGKTRRKLIQARRRGDDSNHWLGEGIAGQESLLIDLDPYLYAADPIISKSIAQSARAYSGDNARALGVIVTPAEAIPWHIAHMRKWCEVCVCAPDYDPLLEEVVGAFDATLYSNGIPSTLEGKTDLLLFGGGAFRVQSEFWEALDLAERMLSPDGRAHFVLRGKGDADNLHVVFEEEIPCGELFAHESLDAFKYTEDAASSFRRLGLEHDLGMGEFWKRHRDFFGKDVRDLVLSRLYEEEFQHLFTSKDEQWSMVLTVVGA